MTLKLSSSTRREYIGKVILTTVFLGGLALFVYYVATGPGWDIFDLSTLDLVLLSFATYRLGRLIAYDRVMEPFRMFFAETKPDATGAGESVEPIGEGFQQSLGQLITCPICAGTWVAALLVYLLYLFPDPTRVFITIMAVIGAAELLNGITEMVCWTGQYARTMSGAQMLAREEKKKDS